MFLYEGVNKWCDICICSCIELWYGLLCKMRKVFLIYVFSGWYRVVKNMKVI